MPKNIVEYVATLTDRVTPTLKKIQASTEKTDMQMQKLDNSMNSIGLAIAGIAVGYGALKAVNIAGEYEQQGVAFETMLGSVEKGQKVLADLDKFATKTPFSIRGVQDSAKQLLAVGIQSENLIPTLKALGDVSAGLSVPMDRLALNYGQVRSQGKLTGKELRDFVVAGVPLTAELAKMLNVSEGSISNMVSAGKIGFPIVEKAFKNMTSKGGRFADLMDKQSKTFNGQVNEMIENIQILARNIGNILIPVFRPLIKGISNTVEFMKKHQKTTKLIVQSILLLVSVIGFIVVAVKIWSFWQGVLNVMLALTASPIILTVAAVMALVGAVYIITDAIIGWMRSTETGTAILQGLKETLSFLWETWKGLAKFMVNFYSKILSALWSRLKVIGKAIMDFLEKPIKMAIASFMNFLTLLEKIPGIGKAIKKIRETFSKGFKKGVKDFRKQQEKTKIGVVVKKKDKEDEFNLLDFFKSLSGDDNNTKVTSAAPKQFNININKLVETFNVMTQNMDESPAKIKEVIEQTLLEAIADIEIAR